MLDRVGFSPSNTKVARVFYEKALKPLGIAPVMEVTPGIAANRACGHYHENYYGAFVLEPDGSNIKAVCHSPK